jgi:uncharacterized protein (DUF2252 family)
MSSLDPAGHPTQAERAARGRAARTAVPRSSHAELELADDRDPIATLEAQARSRLEELVPIRYGRMLASPSSFFRGAAAVMAQDLGPRPTVGLTTQLCGDAHLMNLGGFASPERELVFDLNDFDETLPGPFEWDVKRLAASCEIVGRDRGFDKADRTMAVRTAVRSYREAMLGFATAGELELWYARLDARTIEQQLRDGHDRKLGRALDRAEAKARRKDHLHALARHTRRVNGRPRFVSDPPLLVPVDELGAAADSAQAAVELEGLFDAYRRTLPSDRQVLLGRFRYVDLARKVVGVGSVGTRCWLLLLAGRDEGDPLFLQVKEAEQSVLEPLLGKSRFTNSGRRIVEGQRLMQAASDILLGWIRADAPEGGKRDFYVRQLWDWKASVDVETILPEGLVAYAQVCGWTLARAHARSGDRIAIGAYLGKSDRFDRALVEFATAYADCNARDHAALAAAASAGRVRAVSGV